MIKIELKRLDDDFLMQATNESGNSIQMDASEQIGGKGVAMRPMQVLLASLGGCSTIDIISILRKQRQPITDIQVSLQGEREQGVEPSLFNNIHIHFKIFGDVDPAKAEVAVNLSMEKYCSVAKTLEKTAVIKHSFEIIPATEAK